MNKPFSTGVKAFHDRAQENANYFGVPYACFFDTSGGYRVEKYNSNCSAHRFNATIFYPIAKATGQD